MTAETVCAKRILVWILMTRSALQSQTEKRPAEVLHSDFRPGCGDDLCRGVAALAFLRPMLALQDKTGLRAMVEVFPVKRNEIDVQAPVLRMTARAVQLVGGISVGARVKALPRLEPSLDLAVAFEAFESARACSHTVTGRAVGHAVKRRVGA